MCRARAPMLRFVWKRCRLSRIPAQRRAYGTTVAQDVSKIRNMAFVAHIDSGKTTLTESVLYTTSYLSCSGSVDTGSTTTDFLPVERERGITVQSASIPVKWKDWTFNLIDTPGHADFGMEVESASRVIDGAVVLLDSVEGVEAQTKGVWQQLDRYDVKTRMMFFNKLDRPGASITQSLRSLLANRFHPRPTILTLPIASFNPQRYAHGEPGIEGLVDLVRWNVWKWGGEDADPTCHPLPKSIEELNRSPLFPADHPMVPHLPVARTQLIENLSMVSEELMEYLLDLPSSPSAYLEIEPERLMPHLRIATINNEILPVVCGSALKHVGTQLLLDYVGELFPSPVDVPHEAQTKTSPVRALAWKVTWDAKRGWMTFVRVYSGKLAKQSGLFNASRNQKEKAGKLLLLYASEAQEVDELPMGSVGVVLGLKHTRTGDTLVSMGVNSEHKTALRDITPPPAVVSTSVIPHSHSDLEPVQQALDALSRTDPSVRVDVQEGQLIVQGLGTLHLEIVENKLRSEWNVNFEFGQRRVSYREGLGSGEPPENWNHWSGEVSGKPASVTIPIEVRPMEQDELGDPVWDGNLVIGPKGKPLPSPESISTSRLAAIGDGLATALSNSPHYSLPLTKVYVKVNELPKDVGVSIATLNTATVAVVRKLIRNAGPGPILEPYVHVKISVPEKSFGNVINDLTESGGELLEMGEDSSSGFDGSEASGYSDEGLYVPPSWVSPSGSYTGGSGSQSTMKHVIHASAPLKQMFDYSNRLRAIAEGHGNFEMVVDGFKEVSDSRRLEILREIGRA